MADNTAPGRLELVRSFINTLDLEDHGKPNEVPRQVDRAGVAGWLESNGFIEAVPSDDELDRVIEVRESLRDLAFSNQDGVEPDRPTIAALNDLAAKTPLRVDFSESGADLVPAGTGVDAAIGTLLGIVAESMAQGTWSRLKACAKDSCRWAFYDQARNRSGRWCSMQTCGNRVKAEKFRKRQTT